VLLAGGALQGQTSGAGVEATTIATDAPTGVAYDASGNLYVALKNDHAVVRIDTKGLITTVVGTGEQGFGGDGGPAASALLDSPEGLALDSSGNLYIADTRNHRIREVVNGVIRTIAGTGVAGFAGDGGSATSAQLAHPTAVSVDGAGNVYVADSDNHRIRKISAGTITTVAGDGEQTFSGDGGPATAAGLDTPAGVTPDPATAGRFYISDTHNQRIRVVDAAGNISTLAGTGVKGFAGNGTPAAAAALDRPRGLAVDSAGTLYLADSDNNLIRTIQGASIATVAGSGEQGFAGDTAAASGAVLDTPTAVAVFPDGPVALSDTHNQRTRSLASNVINTVAGIPPSQTEGILLSGPVSTVYGTGTLVATFSNGTNSANGTATLLDSGAAIGSQAFVGNQASFDLSKVHAGPHIFAVTYGGDLQDAPTATGVFLMTVSQATQTLDFPQPPSPVVYGVGVTVPLTATASSGLPVTYTVTGPATVSGATLTLTGSGEVVVTAQAGNQDYETVSVSRTIEVTPVTLTAIAPSTASLGDPAKLLTATGTGFVPNSVILINGSPVATTYVNGTTLTTTLPATAFTTVGVLMVSVQDPTQQQTTAALPFAVIPPPVNVTVKAPSTSNPGTQPSVALTLAAPYPVPVTATFTLTFTPGANGVDDPAVVFQNGERTLSLNLAAGVTTAPAVQIQTGTVTGTIQIVVSLSASGVNVTPTNLQPTVITIPPTVPTLAQVSLSRSGNALTVTIIGYSDTREMTQAVFHFTPIPGESINPPDVTVDVTAAFAQWYSQAASNTYGSEFSYTQPFTLNVDASTVQQVTVTLSNRIGTSAVGSAP
jgi:sugar lactone lactonase YvrE